MLTGIKWIAKTERNATVRPGQHRSQHGPLRVRITSGGMTSSCVSGSGSTMSAEAVAIGNATTTIVARTKVSYRRRSAMTACGRLPELTKGRFVDANREGQG